MIHGLDSLDELYSFSHLKIIILSLDTGEECLGPAPNDVMIPHGRPLLL